MTASAPPLVAGLSSRSGIGTIGGSVQSWICEVPWSALQDVPFGPLLHPNPIDQALASGSQSFRVRPFFGQHSPAFASELAGGSITMTDSQDSLTAEVPTWWKARLMDARVNLLARMADEYDGEIPCIFMGGNSTLYPEPFIRHVGDPATRTNLIAAGYDAVDDMHTYPAELDAWSAFQLTRLAWSLNPWQSVNADGTQVPADTSFTTTMMTQFRDRFADRAVLQNNSIRTPSIKSYTALYSAMQAAGGPLSFQTATMSRVGDLGKTIEWAIAQGAHLVELPSGYHQVLTSAKLKAYDTALRANV